MTENKIEFNSEYCNVKYVEKDNVVLLVWKKFCCFEDEKADVEWGFSVLLPYMAKSDCKICVFIMSKISNIDGEIDLWSKEFMRYFEVKKVLNYEDSVRVIQGL